MGEELEMRVEYSEIRRDCGRVRQSNIEHVILSHIEAEKTEDGKRALINVLKTIMALPD